MRMRTIKKSTKLTKNWGQKSKSTRCASLKYILQSCSFRFAHPLLPRHFPVSSARFDEKRVGMQTQKEIVYEFEHCRAWRAAQRPPRRRCPALNVKYSPGARWRQCSDGNLAGCQMLCEQQQPQATTSVQNLLHSSSLILLLNTSFLLVEVFLSINLFLDSLPMFSPRAFFVLLAIATDAQFSRRFDWTSSTIECGQLLSYLHSGEEFPLTFLAATLFTQPISSSVTGETNSVDRIINNSFSLLTNRYPAPCSSWKSKLANE